MNRFHATCDLPTGPPPEVLDEIDVAWERVQALFHAGFDFSLERLTATELLALACGETVEELLAAPPRPRSAAWPNLPGFAG